METQFQNELICRLIALHEDIMNEAKRISSDSSYGWYHKELKECYKILIANRLFKLNSNYRSFESLRFKLIYFIADIGSEIDNIFVLDTNIYTQLTSALFTLILLSSSQNMEQIIKMYLRSIVKHINCCKKFIEIVDSIE